MKKKIIIEEVVSQEFEIEVSEDDDIYKKVRELYKSGELVLNNSKLTEANVMVLDEDGGESDWVNLHVN